MRNGQITQELPIIASQSLKEKNYWRQNLSGELQKSCFPSDWENISAKQRNSKRIPFALTGELVERLMKLSNSSDSRLHMILTAVVSILLKLYNGNKDIIVGTTIDRQDQEREFINTILPLRNKLEDHMTFKELLIKVRETVCGAVEHQNYPIESILNDLDIAYSGDEFPLFDVMVLLGNIHDRQYLRDIHVNLIFYFNRNEEGINGYLEYNALLYDMSTIERIITYFIRILRKTLFDVHLILRDIEVPNEEEKEHLSFHINDTAVEYPEMKCIQNLFEEQVEKTPNHTAVVDGTTSISYMELNKKSNQLAGLLVESGVKEETIVGLLVERSIEIMVGILGILKAGGAYLPLELRSPIERIKFILEDSGAKPLLTNKTLMKTVDYTHEIILLEDPAIYQRNTRNPGKTSRLDSPAYIIYTSGTTGLPKGVLIEQRSLVNYVCWAAKKYIQGKQINFPFYTSISFDLTVTSIFPPLVTGNVVFVYGSDANELLIEKVIKENNVEAIKLTPSHLKLIRDRGDKGNESNIKRFLVGGEELELQLAKDILAAFNGNVEIYNEYGPTEATVGCMFHQYNPETDKRISVPIGTPLDNMKIYVLDANRKAVPYGVKGEIYIAGVGVARGYLNRPELTAEKFVENPFSPGEKMYNSGDLGRWMENDCLEFLGRTDDQVNIRGFRVELGEIKNQLLKHEKIKDTVVLADSSGKESPQLCAYIVTVSREPLDVPALKTYLSERIPNYMVPTYFVYLEEIPLTPNGKVDIKALPPAYQRMERSNEYVAPGNETERQLVEIWQKELGVKEIGIKDNFFNIGGDSIKSISLLNSINTFFGVHLKLSHIYQNETIDKFAPLIHAYKYRDPDVEFSEATKELEETKNEFLEGI